MCSPFRGPDPLRRSAALPSSRAIEGVPVRSMCFSGFYSPHPVKKPIYYIPWVVCCFQRITAERRGSTATCRLTTEEFCHMACQELAWVFLWFSQTNGKTGSPNSNLGLQAFCVGRVESTFKKRLGQVFVRLFWSSPLFAVFLEDQKGIRCTVLGVSPRTRRTHYGWLTTMTFSMRDAVEGSLTRKG